MTRAARIYLAVIAGAVALALLAGCGPAVTQGRQVPLGLTSCEDKVEGGTYGLSWIRADVAMQDPARLLVAAHEFEHKRQVESFASCADWREWRKVLENRRRAEAMAFCASSLAAIRFAGMGVHEAVWLHASIMSESYPELKVDTVTAYTMIAAHCSEGEQ